MQPQCPLSHEVFLYGITDYEPIPLPKFTTSVECGNSTTGFASPADDHIEARLDLNEYHRIRKHVTFLVRAVGESMIDAGIQEDDLLIVDTRLHYRERDIVVCCLNDCLKAKMLERTQGGRLFLVSRNPSFEPIEVQDCDDVKIFGVVKGLSRKFRHD